MSFDFYNTIREVTGNDYYSFLQQYLTYPRVPTFVYSVSKPLFSNKLRVRYTLEANLYDVEVPVVIGDDKNPTYISARNGKVKEVCISGVSLADFKVLSDYSLVETRIEKSELTVTKPPPPKKKK